MSTADWINGAIAVATAGGVAFALIQFWLVRSEEKEKRLQDRAHKLAAQLQEAEKRRIDNLFTAFGAALKQVQEQQKDTAKEFQDFNERLGLYRSELQSDRAVTKLEVDHIKETLGQVREEIKGMVKYLGEGKFRVSGKKF